MVSIDPHSDDRSPTASSELELNDSTDLVRGALDALTAHIAILDEDGTIVLVNGAWRQFGEENGLTLPESGIGASYLSFCEAGGASTDSKLAQEAAVGVRDVLDGRRPDFHLEYPCHSDTEERWFRLRVTRFRNGAPHLVVAHENVTDAMRGREALRVAGHALETSVAAIVFGDLHGRITFANRAFLDLWGYEAEEEVIGRLNTEFAHDQEQVAEIMHAIRLLGGWSGESTAVRKNGETFEVMMTGHLITDRGGKPMSTMATFMDITDRKRTEERLRERERRLKLVADSLPVLVAFIDADQRYEFNNATYETWFGIPREELRGATMRETLGAEAHAILEPYLEATLAGEEQSFEARVPYQRGGTRFVRMDMIPHRSEGDEVIGFFSMVRDITDRRRSEELRRQQEKLSALGQLAAGVAHEIGNPLASISAVAQNLARKTDDCAVRNKLDLIGEHTMRVGAIVRHLVDFARPTQTRWERCDLNQVTSSALDMIRFDKRAKDIEIQLGFEENLPPMWAMPDSLRQVFVNLALNAFDAVTESPENSRRLQITTRSTKDDAVEIVFQDNGPGVEPEIVDRLFDPFFTTKEVGQGTGLGLAVSHSIVEEHGGSMTVKGRPGRGARFTVRIPILESRPGAVESDAPSPSK